MPTSDTPREILKSSLWYAAAAAAATLLPAQAADAQIVYTDVDPDETATDNPVAIDFDGDGVSEFVVEEREGRVQTVLFTDPTTEQFADAVIGNGIPYGSNTYAYVFPLDAGTEISDASSDFILLGSFQIPEQATFTFGGADPNGWIGAGDKYVGVRFTAGDGAQHFGWVRVEFEEAEVPIVLDYAYETQPDTPIVAGATGVATEADALTDGYLFSQITPNPVAGRSSFDLAVGEAETVSAELFDALGRKVQTLFSGALTPGTTQEVAVISSELPAGVYVIRVTGESFVTSRNVTVVR